jgi:glycosyltransferase involved in cell wall biosynthesis
MSNKKHTDSTAIVGIVVIGRNESKRLLLSLQSMQGSHCPLIYVDSGSTDHSVSIARPLVDCVLELDPAKPFSAARARNEGFEQLTSLFPTLEFIQFVDGDCVLSEGWLEAAKQSMLSDTKRAVVTGHLKECNPEASVYNRLCAMEWKSPSGDSISFGSLGGIFMVRVDAFKSLGGFNVHVIAGEEPELGMRLSFAGYRMTKINHGMAIHDADMTTFVQWWKRSVRAGHAIGQRAHLNGKTTAKDCVKERRSTLFWGMLLPVLALLLLIPTHGLSLLIFLAYLALALKVYLFRRNQNESVNDAILYTKFIILGKFANCLGLLKFYLNRLNKRYEIIEYK